MAVSSYTKNGSTLYMVRAQWRSTKNPSIRFSKQISGLRSESEARRMEARISKEMRDLVVRQEAKVEISGRTWAGVLDQWYQTQTKIRVPFGSISQITLDDAFRGMRKCMTSYDNVLCSDISSLDLMKTFNELTEAGLSFGHRQKMRTKIKSVFDYGIKAGLILTVKNPVHELVLRKVEERKPEILSIGEIRRLVELSFAHKHDWRHVWALALLTGMRNGELYALRWEDIDWDQKLICVSRAFNCRTRSISCTKGGYWRDVPLSQDAIRLLIELKSLTGNQGFVLPRLYRWENGIQAAVLRTFCVEHRLTSIRFHTLRACFATQLLRQGVSSAIVMKVAGWQELKTMQRYIRLAGVEVVGATDGLSVLPPEEIVAKVIAFRSP